MADLPDLERLSLGYNNISGELSCVAVASARTKLKALDAAENRLQGSIPACLLQVGSAECAIPAVALHCLQGMLAAGSMQSMQSWPPSSLRR